MPTSKTIGQMQLDDLVTAVHQVYEVKDAKRSLWDVWMHANHHASGIAEEVRRQASGDKLLLEIADFAMWLFTTIEKLHGQIGIPKPGEQSGQESLIRIAANYSDLLWNKFPGMCPGCYWRRTDGDRKMETHRGFARSCDCPFNGLEKLDKGRRQHLTKSLRAYSKENIKNKPTNIDGWQDLLAHIFTTNLRHLELTSVALHLLEEMGEVADAFVRMYTYKETDFHRGVPSWRQVALEDELADVSSWLFALVEKVDTARQAESRGSREGRLMLSQIIWNRYGSDGMERFVCPHLPQPQIDGCICPVILVPHDRSLQDVRDLVDDDL